MSFLHPEYAIFGLIALILFINKKRTFTHLEFFKPKKFLRVPLLDILILISFTFLLMYPVTSKIQKITNLKNYSLFDDKKKHIILILDVSTSMQDNDAFEKEKEAAKWDVLENKGSYIMIVVFEQDYKIIQPFTADTDTLFYAIDSLKFNMVTNIGGSMLRDTVAGIINGFRDLNPEIIIYTDGSENDTSSVTKEELKEMAKGLNIKYIGYGNSKNNVYYSSIFSTKPTKNHSFSKNEIISKEIKYEVFDDRFIYLTLILLIIKILDMRFNIFDKRLKNIYGR